MTQEERYKITSNDYMDIIIPYNGNQAILDQFQNYSVHIMNEQFAVAYVPAAEITDRAIQQFGYSAIPKCYGLNVIRSLEESGVERLRRLPTFNLRGQGVLIGIIDTGIDYTNPVFIHEDGTSKIVSIWDQTIDSEDAYPEGTFYGTEYTQEQISRALQSEDPFQIVPSRDDNGHGTMMAGIAAGNEDLANNFSGVVPDSEIAVVKLKPAKQVIKDFFVIPENAIGYQSNDIMWAVQYLVGVSRRLHRPISIAIGLGSSQGAHDGRAPLSDLLSVIADFTGVVITIAGGNEGNARRHFYGTIDPAVGNTTVELNIGENETGFSMELWGAAPGTYSIDILSPSGEYIPRIAEGLQVYREISFIFERTTISIDYQMVESVTGDQLILMRFRNPSAGTWRFQVYGRGDIQGSFHLWLPMGDFITNDTYFIQSNPYTTITSPGTAIIPITATAYNPNNNALYPNSGKGYTRIDIIKPELAAPGVNLTSPDLQHGYRTVTGTSVAAAHTAGIAAILLEWGIVNGNYPNLDTLVVKQFLIRGARRGETLLYPNRDWGYGIIDIYNAFDTLRAGVIGR